ncbi:organic cation transporter protein-like isoform X2 [Antedon mediterranea]|uniref:organic cation transporter protein-like isoform X2 n=1 Tax=Antedon mediterranea TaxID=105859 RepID=UPI003AF75D07
MAIHLTIPNTREPYRKTIGRKPTLLICIAIQCSLGLVTAFVQSFAAYCILRFIVAAASIGIFLVAFIIATELVGLKWRTIAGTMIQVYWAVGIILMALLAYFIRDWRKLQIVLSIPTVVGLLYVPFLPESVRWLLSQGATEKAEAIIQKTAKVNNVTISEHPFSEKNQDGNMKKHTFLDLFKTRVLINRTLNIMYNWLVIVMVYYGLSLSTSDLGIDPYIAFMLSGLIEIPAYIISILAIDYFGRRIILSIVMITGGVACFLTIFFEPGIIRLIVAMIGKFGLTSAFGIVYIYSAELFPTPVRSAGMGLASMSGRLGSIVSPFALYMKQWWEPLPLVLFSSMSLSGGLLCLLLPETMGKKLPETMQEGKEIGLKEHEKTKEDYSAV